MTDLPLGSGASLASGHANQHEEIGYEPHMVSGIHDNMGA
jgi:hypothetical protein